MQHDFRISDIPAGTEIPLFVRAGDRGSITWRRAGIVERTRGRVAVRFAPARKDVFAALWQACRLPGPETDGRLVVAFAVRLPGGAMVEIARGPLTTTVLSEVQRGDGDPSTVRPAVGLVGPDDIRDFAPARVRSSWPAAWRLAGRVARA
jgi:hypothetical protein